MICTVCNTDQEKFCKGLCKKCYNHQYKQTEKYKKYKEDFRKSQRYINWLHEYIKRDYVKAKHTEYEKTEKCKITRRKYGKTEKHINYQKEYEHSDKRKQYKKEHKKRPEVWLRMSLRRRLKNALNGRFKSGSAVRDLGCSIPEFKKYLESKFQPGMTWENYGKYGWHMDHIIPLVAFDLSDREQFLKACHYTNLQPLWATDNLRKGAKLPESFSNPPSAQAH